MKKATICKEHKTQCFVSPYYKDVYAKFEHMISYRSDGNVIAEAREFSIVDANAESNPVMVYLLEEDEPNPTPTEAAHILWTYVNTRNRFRFIDRKED